MRAVVALLVHPCAVLEQGDALGQHRRRARGPGGALPPVASPVTREPGPVRRRPHALRDQRATGSQHPERRRDAVLHGRVRQWGTPEPPGVGALVEHGDSLPAACLPALREQREPTAVPREVDGDRATGQVRPRRDPGDAAASEEGARSPACAPRSVSASTHADTRASTASTAATTMPQLPLRLPPRHLMGSPRSDQHAWPAMHRHLWYTARRARVPTPPPNSTRPCARRGRGIIPAGAGSRTAAASWCRSAWDHHPRGCGDDETL